MDSFTPYYIPAIIFTLLGVSALIFGGWGAYTAIPDGPPYHYSVNGADDVPSDSKVIQFTNLSETSQEVFLKALNDGGFDTDKKASGITIGSDHRGINYVEYQDQTYAFIASTNHSGWWVFSIVLFTVIGLVGLTAILLGFWFMKSNQFKLPTAALSGVLAISILRLPSQYQLIEPPRMGYHLYTELGVLLLPPILIWSLLKGLEHYWDTSFSQRMEG